MHKIGNTNVETRHCLISTKKNSAFTLVELIIVITILAILATIGFMSFQGYTMDARDSNRVTSLRVISDGLNIYQAKNTSLAMPDDYVTISASGTPISYQGYAGKSILSSLKASDIKDPSDNSYYTYSINADKNKFQLLGFLENNTGVVALSPDSIESGLVDQTYATNYTSRYPTSLGDKLGILMSTGTSSPIQELKSVSFTGVDVITGTSEYKVSFSNNDTVTASGNTIFSNIYNHRSDLINNKAYASLDNSLVGYWDMETLTGGLLKDLSKYGNNGTCYNSGTAVNCGAQGTGPQIVDGNGTAGKAMSFDGVDDWISVANSSSIGQTFNEITLIVKFYENIVPNTSSGSYLPLNKSNSYRLALGQNNNHIAVNTINNTWYSTGTYITSYLNKLNSKTYYILTGKYDGIYTKIFLDGLFTAKGDQEISGNLISNTNNLEIANNVGVTTTKMNGSIDEIRIYNRALSDAEIKALNNIIK